MKRIFSTIFCILFTSTIITSFAQSTPINKPYKEEVVETLSQLMKDFYVFPEIAKETEKHLKSQLKSGHFDVFTEQKAFAKALTESVQFINKDKHMRIMANKPFVEPENTPERKVAEKLDYIDRFRRFNSGLNTVKILEGNVGYLDLRGFAGFDRNKHVVDAYMTLLSNCDAIIIDLSKNGGGDPNMVQYLCSFFFDTKVHLNSLYWREGDITQEFWTLENIEGSKMPNVPLMVITGNNTFSGAEEFSYNMQTQKRATLIGQTTGGGANPGRTMPINKDLGVFIPMGKAINPITKTNWEGVGVVPEVKTTIEGALDKAHELAQEEAEVYRAQRKDNFTSLYLELNNSLKTYHPKTSDKFILNHLKECKAVHLLGEGDINTLGYNYLMDEKKPKVAECIFRANTILYPNSANVFDSYGETLLLNGSTKQAIVQYQKAVDLAKENNEPNLELFQLNLANAKKALHQ